MEYFPLRFFCRTTFIMLFTFFTAMALVGLINLIHPLPLFGMTRKRALISFVVFSFLMFFFSGDAGVLAKLLHSQ